MAEVVLLQGAENDLVTLYGKQSEQSFESAEDFSSAVDRTISELASFPRLGSPFEGQFRRKLVFSYYQFGIFYTIDLSRVVVHAVIDLRQDPEQIMKRLSL